MKKYIHIWIIVAVFAAGAGFYLYGVYEQNSEQVAFVSSLGGLSQDAGLLAKINGFQIENEKNGSFNINGFVADPSNNKYYTDKPVQLAQFASSTNLSITQINTLLNFAKQTSYIERTEGDVNIGPVCTDENKVSSPCTVVEFYLSPSLFSAWFSDPASWYSYGYMYVPFALTQNNQAYFDRYFGTMKNLAPNWYSFSGKHP
jgi:hypothetical protein